MANLKVTNADGTVQYVRKVGAGTDADPFSDVMVGGLITITNAARVVGGRGIIRGVKLGAVVAIAYELHLFNADLATPNVLNNDPMTLVVADSPKWEGWIPIVAADYCTITPAAFTLAHVRNLNAYFKTGASTTSLYAYLKATAATSPGTTNMDLTITIDYLD